MSRPLISCINFRNFFKDKFEHIGPLWVAVENGSNEKDFGSDWDGGESFIKVFANIFYK